MGKCIDAGWNEAAGIPFAFPVGRVQGFRGRYVRKGFEDAQQRYLLQLEVVYDASSAEIRMLDANNGGSSGAEVSLRSKRSGSSTSSSSSFF